MVTIRKNYLVPGFRGAVAKTVVIKQYAEKTVLTAYPDMSKVRHTEKQKGRQGIFAAAVSYARSINNNAVLKAAYAARIGEGKSVYHTALSEYLLTHKV